MSNSRGFEALTTTTGTSSHYIYFPAELNDRGKTVRRLIVFRKSKFEYANADQTTPEDRERVKCYVKVGTKSRDLIDEARTLNRYLSEEHDPRNKMNRVMTAWASKGWVFDAQGKPLPSSPPAPSEQSRARTDMSKSTHPQTSSQPEKANKKKRDVKVGPFLVSETDSDSGSEIVSSNRNRSTSSRPKDANNEKNKPRKGPLKEMGSERVSSNPPTSSRPTNANNERNKPREGPFLESDIESDPDSLFVSQRKPRHPKSAAGGKERVGRGGERTVQDKMPIRSSLARELFPSDEDNDTAALESRRRPKPAEGGKNPDLTEPARKKMNSTDSAGGKSNERERRENSGLKRVETTGERSVGTARRRDGRSRSPGRTPKKPEVQRQRGEGSHNSSRPTEGVAVKKESRSTGRERSSRPHGDELASNAGIYRKSKSLYKGPRANWVEEDTNRAPTKKELQDMELEDAEKQWKKNGGGLF
ncbi:hypothetical protein BOTCAL_1121g00010 [Botryotinia calthae]|uniref:Uncharacterized protein n=1 Tax=Botryotinia calthae TaxID=38488 RepID=A0A4Y8CDJ6_9HELO|nr:hypothetical protein BOTCAL_1121g00010 [Botryotinia calthae]